MPKRRIVSSIEEWENGHILSIVGPTGSGKTSLIQTFIEESPLRAEDFCLVSVDSIAVYKGFDIGSAKPSSEERLRFAWKGIDLIEATETLSAHAYVRRLKDGIDLAIEQGKRIVFVGGSLFYERALVEGAGPGEASDKSFLEELKKEGEAAVRSRLIEFDTAFEGRLHENDHYRLFRYADLCLRQGFTLTELDAPPHPPFEPIVDTLILGVEPKVSDDALRKRIRQMLDAGWEEEVQEIVARFGKDLYPLESVGYRELVSHLEKPVEAAQLCDEILVSHRRLAKKQRTWLRGLKKKYS